MKKVVVLKNMFVNENSICSVYLGSNSELRIVQRGNLFFVKGFAKGRGMPNSFGKAVYKCGGDEVIGELCEELNIEIIG
jgi:hypothetical protein